MVAEIKHVKGQDGNWHKIGPEDRDYGEWPTKRSRYKNRLFRVPVGFAFTTSEIKEIISEFELAIKEKV